VGFDGIQSIYTTVSEILFGGRAGKG